MLQNKIKIELFIIFAKKNAVTKIYRVGGHITPFKK